MKTKITFRLAMVFVMMVILNTSCSIEKLADSFKCDSAPLLEEANVEKIFYQEAFDAYNQEQSVDNCQELQNSGKDYIDAVQRYLDCSEAGDEQIKRELKEVKAALADLEC